MEGRDQRRAAIVELPPAQPRDRIHRLEQRLGGELAERHDHARLDDVDLPEQVGLALLHFVGFRIAIAGRPALDDVGDVDLIARQADGLDDLGQQLPGTAHEGLAPLVFFLARRLTDEHQPRFRVADAEDDLRSAHRAQLATTTVWTDIGFDDVERVVVYPAKAGHHRISRDVFGDMVVSAFRRIDSVGPLPPLHIFAHALDTEFGEVAEVLRNLTRHGYVLTGAFPPSPRLRRTSSVGVVRNSSTRSRIFAATAVFACNGSSSAPAAVTSVTALVSTSKPASARDTSLATMRSTRFCFSFSCAYDNTSLVSAAKPMSTGNRCCWRDGSAPRSPRMSFVRVSEIVSAPSLFLTFCD